MPPRRTALTTPSRLGAGCDTRYLERPRLYLGSNAIMIDETSGPTSRIFFSQRLRLHYVDWGNAGAPPLLLIDDIMGELDTARRSAFLPLLEEAHAARGQVFMTATERWWPEELGRELKKWEVASGTIGPL